MADVLRTHLSQEVRTLRAARRWTLDEAAARLGVSRRLLAQIEASEANPSLSTLLRVADGFGVHLSELLDHTASTAITVGVEPDAAPELWSSALGGSARLLAARGALELWQWTLAPGDEHTAAAHHGGSAEAVHVVEGTLTLSIDGDDVAVAAGSSAVFDADRAHAYRNVGDEPAIFMLSVYDPSGA